MSVPFNDFREMVAGVEIDDGLTWDFRLPTGVTLAGTPTVTVTVYEHSGETDPDPQSKLTAKAVGTAAGGVASCAVVAQFGPGLAGVRYLFTVSCAKSTGGTARVACFNKLLCVAPG